MNLIKPEKKKRKGFTLVEMLVVIGIIAILVAVIIPIVSNSTKRSRAATNAANLRSWKAVLTTKLLNGELKPSDFNPNNPLYPAAEGKFFLIKGWGINDEPYNEATIAEYNSATNEIKVTFDGWTVALWAEMSEGTHSCTYTYFSSSQHKCTECTKAEDHHWVGSGMQHCDVCGYCPCNGFGDSNRDGKCDTCGHAEGLHWRDGVTWGCSGGEITSSGGDFDHDDETEDCPCTAYSADNQFKATLEDGTEVWVCGNPACYHPKSAHGADQAGIVENGSCGGGTRIEPEGSDGHVCKSVDGDLACDDPDCGKCVCTLGSTLGVTACTRCSHYHQEGFCGQTGTHYHKYEYLDEDYHKCITCPQENPHSFDAATGYCECRYRDPNYVDPSHEHEFTRTEYTHSCTADGCDVKNQDHNFVNGECACGLKRCTSHTFDYYSGTGRCTVCSARHECVNFYRNKCKVCGKQKSTDYSCWEHIDTNNDGTCDSCKVHNHKDDNADLKCDYCGKCICTVGTRWGMSQCSCGHYHSTGEECGN